MLMKEVKSRYANDIEKNSDYLKVVTNGSEDISDLSKEFDVKLNDVGITIDGIRKLKKNIKIPEKNW